MTITSLTAVPLILAAISGSAPPTQRGPDLAPIIDQKTLKQMESDPQKMFKPVDLQCPARPGEGTLKLTEMNNVGETSVTHILYENDVMLRVTEEHAQPGQPLKVIKTVDINETIGRRDQKYVDRTAERTYLYRTFACEEDKTLKFVFKKMIQKCREEITEALGHPIP